MPNNHLIIGAGEVGAALFEVLSDVYPNVRLIDMLEPEDMFDVTYLHICYPYSESFIGTVEHYKEQYQPVYTIIHSTVPVGTSRLLAASHSPIRGVHPDLEEGIRTFPKFIGGHEASKVADIFRKAGLKVILCDDSDTTEAGKLFDTEYYRVCIEFTKRVKQYCDQQGLNFHEVYTLFNQTYNEGYAKLGHEEYIRPVLQPIMTEIGGHCVVANSKLLAHENHPVDNETI